MTPAPRADRRPTARATLAALLAFALAGCSGGYRSDVTGRVTIDDQPPLVGERVNTAITFYPKAKGPSAYGVADESGAYRLQIGDAHGLPPGDYKVTVEITELAPPPPGGYVNAPGFKRHSHPVYADRETTPLRFEVAEGANTIDLALRSEPEPTR